MFVRGKLKRTSIDHSWLYREFVKVVVSKNFGHTFVLPMPMRVRNFQEMTHADFEIFNINVGPFNMGSIVRTSGKTAFKFIVGKRFLRS